MEKKERSTYFWRYDGDPDARQRINDWMDQQNNVRDSLQMLVLYFADRFGDKNVMDYEVQKKLYADVIERSLVETKQLAAKTEKEEINRHTSSPSFSCAVDHADKIKDEAEDIFGGIDLKNI
ncbi:MAG: hypothetical protein ABF586_12740 [Sporolactobacillus sp.]